MGDLMQVEPSEWVDLQKKVFTNWVNMHLRPSNIQVNDITKDFSDGIILVRIAESLTKKKITGFVKNPTSRLHSINNANLALKAITESGIKLTCGPEDIVDGNFKLLLGLMWTLILRFQISNNNLSGDVKMPPKDALMGWTRQYLQQYPDLQVKDFHQSWQDGVNFCALVHRVLPDKIDLESIDESNRLHNLSRAFEVAEIEFGIPKLLDAQDIFSRPLGKPDEQIIMTYVSMFPLVYQERRIVEPPLPGEINYGLPIKDEPVKEQPKIEQPIIEQPIIEQPIIEQPIIEQPKIEALKVEEPKIEEPIKEEEAKLEDIQTLRVALKRQESSLHHYEESVKQKDDEVVQLRTNIVKKEDEVVKLRTDIVQKDDEVVKLKIDIGKKDEVVQQLASDLEKKDKRLEELEKTLVHQDKDYVTNLATSLAKLTSEYQTIQSNLAALQDKFVSNSRVLNMYSTSLGAEGDNPPVDPPITWVFTDVQDSTPLWEKDPGLVQNALQTHNTIIRRAIKNCNGYEIRTQGDSFVVSFFTPIAAAEFCIIVQKELLDANWPVRLPELLPSTQTVTDSNDKPIYKGLRVRMGIHTGVPDFCERDATSKRMDYFGPAMNLAARIGTLPAGGQIIVSSTTHAELSKNLPFAATVTMSDLGTFRLKGVEHTQQVFDMTPKDWVVRNFPKPTPALTEVQLKADLSQIRDENARITEEMERLKAQLTETLERTEAVQKLIAAHKHDDSHLEKEVAALIKEQEKTKAQLAENLDGIKKLTETVRTFDLRLQEMDEEKHFMQGVGVARLREIQHAVTIEVDKRRETKVRDALTEQLEKLREEIDAQLQDSTMFTAENLATAHANFINSRYQFFLYQAASIPQSQPTNSVSTSTYIMPSTSKEDALRATNLALACLVFYIIGIVSFGCHLISIWITFYMLARKMITRKHFTIMLLCGAELMAWTSLAALGWLNFGGYWWGYIPLSVWFGVMVIFGVIRMKLIFDYRLRMSQSTNKV